MSETLIIVGLILLFVILLGKGAMYFGDRRIQKLNESRPKIDRSEYIALLTKEGFDLNHVEVVHDTIREVIQMDDFSIYPEDSIHDIYGIDDLDDVELIDLICKRLNLGVSTQEDCDELNSKFTKTNAYYILELTKKLEEKKVHNKL